MNRNAFFKLKFKKFNLTSVLNDSKIPSYFKYLFCFNCLFSLEYVGKS